MPTAHQGVVYGNYQIPRYAQITYATAGFGFNHATEAGSVGLRKTGKLTKKAIGPKDVAGRTITDKIDVQIEAEMLQTRIADLKNMYLLSKGYHQLLLQTNSGMYYAFTDNTGTFASPTGSALVGLNWDFEVTDKDRSLKCTWNTQMANTEWDWILTNSGSAATGSSGGTSGGLTAHAYARANYDRSGINSVTINGVDIGFFKDPKISLKSKEVDKDTRNRQLPCLIDVACEVTMLQTKANDLLAVSTDEQQEYTVIFNTWNDEIFKFTTGAVSITGETEISDEHTMTKLVFEGLIPYSDDTSAVDLGTTDAATAEFKLIGY
jgi:hypothetical protein